VKEVARRAGLGQQNIAVCAPAFSADCIELEKEINEEINKAEKEIIDLKNKSPEKIRKIAVETSSDLIKRLLGIDVNNSSISSIVEDVSRKAN
jgi:protoheme ferro-lyase